MINPIQLESSRFETLRLHIGAGGIRVAAVSQSVGAVRVNFVSVPHQERDRLIMIGDCQVFVLKANDGGLAHWNVEQSKDDRIQPFGINLKHVNMLDPTFAEKRVKA
jgi:hypothetical protein